MDKVAEAFGAPLAHFLDPRNHQEHSILHEEAMRRLMPCPGTAISSGGDRRDPDVAVPPAHEEA